MTRTASLRRRMKKAKGGPRGSHTAAAIAALAILLAGAAPVRAGTETVPAPPATPSGADLEDYVVVNGDTCVKIARDRYGDPRRVADIHKYNSLGPAPHRLRVGSILHLPRTGNDTGPEAQITFVRNQVEAFTPEPKPAVVNDELYRGHKVSTKDRSSAELLFVDETRVQLGERTLIVMLGRGGMHTVTDAPETTLVTGALRARLDELAGGAPRKTPVVKTEAAELALGTGEVKVDVDDRKSTRLAVYRGRSAARARHKTVEVAEGFGSRTDPGNEPGAPQPLPPAPQWTTPPPAQLAVKDLGTFTAKYGQAAGATPVAAAWHVQIARDETFNDLMVDVQVPETTRDLQATALVPGVYHVRVSAVDGDAFEGPFGAPSLTSVALAPPPPPPPPPPAPPPPAPPPPPVRRPWVLGGAILGGLDVSGSPSGKLGPAAGLELGLAHPRPDAAFTPIVGLRSLYEHLGASAGTLSSAAVTQRDGFTLALLGMGRFGRGEARLNAYVAVTPQLTLARVQELGGRVFAHAWVGVGALAGLGLKVGPGHAILEVDGRYPTRRPILSPDAQLGFLQVLVGYRFAL